jgi:hypothetical protein
VVLKCGYQLEKLVYHFDIDQSINHATMHKNPNMQQFVCSCMVAFFASRTAAQALDATGTYTLDPAWPIGTYPPPSGVDVSQLLFCSNLVNDFVPSLLTSSFCRNSSFQVDPVAGEVYMSSQTGYPRVTVWSTKTGEMVRSWGNGES